MSSARRCQVDGDQMDDVLRRSEGPKLLQDAKTLTRNKED